MVILNGRDINGPFFRNNDGHKFYYTPNNKVSRENAYKQALKQMKSMYANGFKSKSKK